MRIYDFWWLWLRSPLLQLGSKLSQPCSSEICATSFCAGLPALAPLRTPPKCGVRLGIMSWSCAFSPDGVGIRTHHAHEILPAVGCTRRLHVLEVRIGEVCMQIQQNGGIQSFTLSATSLNTTPFLVQTAALFLAQKLKLGDSKTNAPVLTQLYTFFTGMQRSMSCVKSQCK